MLCRVSDHIELTALRRGCSGIATNVQISRREDGALATVEVVAASVEPNPTIARRAGARERCAAVLIGHGGRVVVRADGRVGGAAVREEDDAPGPAADGRWRLDLVAPDQPRRHEASIDDLEGREAERAGHEEHARLGADLTVSQVSPGGALDELAGLTLMDRVAARDARPDEPRLGVTRGRERLIDVVPVAPREPRRTMV